MSALRRWWECRMMCGSVMAYLDGEPADAARVQRHLARCAACREFARMHAAQARVIETLPAEEDPPAGFVDRVMQRIAVPEPRPMRTHLSLRPAFAAVSAAAAIAIIAAALWLGLLQSSQTPVAHVSQPPVPTRIAGAPAGPAPTKEVTPAVTPAPAPERASTPVSTGSVRTASAAKVVRPQARPATEPGDVAETHRDAGRSLEEQGQFDQALEEYAAARDDGGSEMARLDMARVYEKSGYTDEALGELVEVAFSDVDQSSWEPLTVQ